MTDETAPRGERKKQVIIMMDEEGPMGAEEIARRCDIAKSTVYTMMERWRRCGDVEVKGAQFIPNVGQQPAEYHLTEAGHAKAEHFRGQQ